MAVNELSELNRILNKGWVALLSKQDLNSWDVKMAMSHWALNNGEYCVCYGICSNLVDALTRCENYLLREYKPND